MSEEQFTPDQYSGPSEFVHLHNHTVFSALDGVSTPEQYAEQCYLRGYPAMSATEHGHMASVPDMYLAFKKYGIKYLSGCEIYYNDYEPERQRLVQQGFKPRSREWREQNPDLAQRIGRNRHLTVLCKNQTGFHNLIRLTTQAYETGLFGMGRTQYNRIWFDKLCEFKEGLIILSGCLNGPVSHELRYKSLVDAEGNTTFERDKSAQLNAAVKYIKKFRKVFGEDYFIEVQMPGIEDDDVVFRQLITIADNYKISVVLTNDVHYLNQEDYILQKLMMAVSQQTTIDSPNLFHVNSDAQYMKSRAELWATFKNNRYSKGFDDRLFEQMCDNTLMVAERCNTFTVDTAPKYPEISDADTQLRTIVAKELQKRGLDTYTKKFVIDGREVTYVEQAKIELKRFIDKGFSSYFLITRDLIQYGKRRGWPFSPRGCSVPEGLITMADGAVKPIIDVECGDEILDGFGDKRKILNKFAYDVGEELIEIQYDGGGLLVTRDHKLYVVRNDVVMLLKASELVDTDEIINTNSDKTASHENIQGSL